MANNMYNAQLRLSLRKIDVMALESEIAQVENKKPSKTKDRKLVSLNKQLKLAKWLHDDMERWIKEQTITA